VTRPVHVADPAFGCARQQTLACVPAAENGCRVILLRMHGWKALTPNQCPAAASIQNHQIVVRAGAGGSA